MDNALWTALGLMLVLEGALPLLAPALWRQTFQRMLAMSDGQLRFVGLSSMLGGLILVMMVR